MSRSICSAALILGLALAAPAFAQGKSTAIHPAAVIDTGRLTAESDFTVFMRADVPEDVRRVALRRLWALMQFSVACDELCYHAEPMLSGLAWLASEKLPVASR